eukprot:SM012283S25892  [mRNA]  locus=s12283:1:421:+ [translate_table: standard]
MAAAPAATAAAAQPEAPPSITLHVAHGKFGHELRVPATATFWQVKEALVGDTGLAPGEQKLLFRGRVTADGESLLAAGVRDRSKLMLLEDEAAHARRAEEQRLAEEA